MMKVNKIAFAAFAASAVSTSALHNNYLNNLSVGGQNFQQAPAPYQPPAPEPEPAAWEAEVVPAQEYESTEIDVHGTSESYEEQTYEQPSYDQYQAPPRIPVGYGYSHQNNRKGGMAPLKPGVFTTSQNAGTASSREKMEMLNQLLNASPNGEPATM
eukprot:CAMPEP_0172356082 /NCGR_PEP_ID=MMETSP1060-20121228/406_1 /TAXON_ID=37318 /ORGANISM="Pseudo-nitzschia pungens, Strain cf. cingulata" /LENGTH=156 /DNA_ID=CAMNT_0013075983 /DNA_START=46 /DNA_END=513 /DNA_ORIENTATION=-